MTKTPQVQICYGDIDYHLNQLKKDSHTKCKDRWTINTSSKPGDIAVFYLLRPVSSFVATGRVCSYPEREKKGYWKGYYMADVDHVKMLPEFVHLHRAQAKFKSWGWLRAPHRSTTVPTKISSQFLEFIKSDVKERSAKISDIEGIRTEATFFKAHRSRWLRELAMSKAHGICCVCGRDFSKILDGRGVRALQVHHKQQLSSTTIPRKTTLNDLAVVCANCHMLIHLDPKKPLKVEKLRAMLIKNGNMDTDILK